MSIWDTVKQRAKEVIDDVRRDPRFEQSFHDAGRFWQELESEVELIRRQLKENKTPVVDDTADMKEKLDAYRKRNQR